MKKGFIMLLGAILASLVLCAPAWGDEDVNIIIVDPNDSGAEVIHRLPAQAPVLCSLVENSLEVTFLFNLGAITVEIENQTTGEYSQTVMNAVAGPMVFPISGNAGFWTITFTLSNGAVYYGEFVL